MFLSEDTVRSSDNETGVSHENLLESCEAAVMLWNGVARFFSAFMGFHQNGENPSDFVYRDSLDFRDIFPSLRLFLIKKGKGLPAAYVVVGLFFVSEW